MLERRADQKETEVEDVSTKEGSTQDNEAQGKVTTHTKYGYIHKDMGTHVDACMPKQANRPSARAIELSRESASSAKVRSSRESDHSNIGVTEDRGTREPERWMTRVVEDWSGQEPELTGAPEWQRAGAVKC